jgi:hypothetical protein
MSVRLSSLVGLLTALTLSVATTSAAEAGDGITVETVSGELLKKEGFKSLADGQVVFSDGSLLPVDDLHVVRFAGTITKPSPSHVAIVHLSGGGRFPVRDAVIVDDACEVTLADGRKTKLSLEDVAAIQWVGSADAAWKDSLAKASEEHDFVVLKAQPRPTAVRAFVEKIGPESIEFDWDKETRTVERSQVIGIVFARPKSSDTAKVRVSLTTGAALPVTRLERLEDHQLRCTLAHGSTIDLPAAELASINVRSSRVKSLSEMTPSRVTERPIAALPRGWKADVNVRGEPLRAGAETFDQGIGVQSGTSLTYELDGEAEQFAAVLALDPPSGIAGDCEFVLSADGQEVARRRLKSGDEPIPVRVPLKGVRQLELRVDYGSNLDFGDHANWCDAHLVLSSRPAGAT